jgi:amidase
MSDSYNHVFKQSLNSLNKAFISGGSSGGEGALVGALGSIIGIGTDIGGSIRIPGVLQGLYALNPTVGRVPNDPSG